MAKRKTFTFSAELVREALNLPEDAEVIGIEYQPRFHSVSVHMVGEGLPEVPELGESEEERKNHA